MSSVLLAASASTAIVGYYCGTTRTNRESTSSNENGQGLLQTLASYKNPVTVGVTVAVAVATTNCQGNFFNGENDGDDASSSSHHKEAKLKRKKTALQVAANLRKMNTREQISKLRVMKDEMLRRWERDEDGWRELPARAWPEYQPNAQELGGIVAEIQRLGCNEKAAGKKRKGQRDREREKDADEVARCKQLLFDMATGLVFYNVDPEAGFALYEKLAKEGHTPSMVACGIVLIDGLGVPPREKEGFVWLQKAMESPCGDSSMSVAQAMYELGTVYYTGIDGVVEEDPEKAFELFERAAELDHTAALYMVADCLVEGEGTERSVAKAVPLFYKAAERGHRYSRQRIRELLARVDYPL